MKLKKQKMLDRKADARRKILMGGLVVKAELQNLYEEDASILYGMLLDCKKTLEVRPELKSRWQKLGEELLSNVNSDNKFDEQND